MKTRRDFFHQFIGRAGVMNNNNPSQVKIPLNRLNELPENIIEQIEPMFFPDEIWRLKGRLLIISGSTSAKGIDFELSDIELKAFKYLQKGIKLKQTALNIKNESELSFDVIYRIVTSLFFKLASLRICHPREFYNIDEIVKAKKDYSA